MGNLGYSKSEKPMLSKRGEDELRAAPNLTLSNCNYVPISGPLITPKPREVSRNAVSISEPDFNSKEWSNIDINQA